MDNLKSEWRAIDRRQFVQTSAAGVAAMAVPSWLAGQGDDLNAVRAAVEKGHPEALARLQAWIREPSIAAENRLMTEGCNTMMRMLREAGFDNVKKMPTKGHPGVFATLDAGAPRTLGIYFMYDVKQADPQEWSSPPFDARVVERPGLGKVLMARGATNQKGPEATFLAALHAMKAAGRKLPVNLVFVAEGEEEIGSPNFKDVVHAPEVMAALRKCGGVFMPFPSQDLDGNVTVFLGAKGVVELELIASGEKWGRGPKKDIHSSNKARVDAPAWRLVQALNTLVTPDGNDPAIDNYFAKVRPISAAEKKMVADAAKRISEESTKRSMGVQHWARNENWQTSLESLISRPTVNIEGLVGGYTGPGGKTILPAKAVAKIDLRLVPDMTAAESLALLKTHLAKRGYSDIEVNMSGGYDPTSTAADAAIIRAELAAYRANKIDAVVMPRLAGSWPGYIFTGEPLKLPAGHFGMGNGGGAHAPDEYYVIESANPKVAGMMDATFSYVQFLYEYARTA